MSDKTIIHFESKLYIPVKYGVPKLGEDYIAINGVVAQLISLDQSQNLASIGLGGPIRLIVRRIDKPDPKKAKKLDKVE